MANQTTVDTAPLLAMPTSRPSLDQVIQVIGGERSGEFAPAYMPEYAGLRGIPAQAMVMPTQFAAMPQFAAPVQQAPVPVARSAGRTFTPFVVPERKAVTEAQKELFTGQTPIARTTSGELIYALPAKPGGIDYTKHTIIGRYNGMPVYAEAPPADPNSYMGNKEGGLIALAKGGSVAQEAQGLASLGRGGDNMLVHMSPEEVSGLRALAMQQGTDLTINPDTGLPEALKLKKLFRALAPVLPFVLPMTAPLSLAMKAGLSGLIGGFAAPGKGFNFKQGLKTGLMAYAGGKMMGMDAAQAGTPGTTGAPGTPGTPAAPADVGAAYGGVDGAFAAPPTPYTPVANTPIDMTAMAPTGAGQYTPIGTNTPIDMTAMPPAPPSDAAVNAGIGGSEFPGNFSTRVETAAPPAATVDASGKPVKEITGFEQATGISPTTAVIGGGIGLSAIQASKEMDLFQQQAAAEAAEREKRRREGEETFARSLGQVPVYRVAGGGLIALARGGMPTFEYGGTTAQTGEPRMVKGAGDGMSDNVPANIEGVQEARLANDEFVVPADVVADIGNGSSSAGAKKLYAMMDRIRNARHGTTEQPPEIKAERFMPA